MSADTTPSTPAQDHQPDAGVTTTAFLVQGMHCSSCAALIETRLRVLPSIAAINVDIRSGRAVVQWRTGATDPNTIVREIEQLGFHAALLEQATVTASSKRERDDLLRRLAVAGLGMMQVTMFAVATYLGVDGDMEPAVRRLLVFVSMLVATPVVFYAGAPFLRGAWVSLRNRLPNMDVPVSLALLLAYGASCINFFRGDNSTYFESATMFVFLLLSARFITVLVRHRALDSNLALLPLLPNTVLRIVAGKDQRVPRAALRPGDRLRVRPGDSFAADGVIEQGTTTVNEAMLTGESQPRLRTAAERVLAGSVNLDGSIVMRVTALAADTRIAQMAALLDQAQQTRPRQVRLANQIASYFVQSVLLLAAIVFALWWRVDPAQAFSATLAVLVVTCPCALALATPTVLSAAAARLARAGLLLQNLDALETLTQVDLALFDKTGTLSRGQPSIGQVDTNPAHPSPVDHAQLLGIVAALEQHSNHPLARAFVSVSDGAHATDVKVVPGYGIAGTIGDRSVRIGNGAFTGLKQDTGAAINACDQHGLLGRIDVVDGWRDDAATVIGQLQQRGIACEITSGDQHSRVARAVTELGLDSGVGALEPEAKLAALRASQQAGRKVLAVGDGVNDGALLAGADVSIALAGGADLAKSGADIILAGDRLAPIVQLFDVADAVRRIVRQNLAWAIGYNAVAVPLAAFGFIGPGLAALGMSLSSLLVIMNAARVAAPARGQSVAANSLPRSQAVVAGAGH